MAKSELKEMVIPFCGFYGSTYADLLDREQEQWIEYEVDERQTEEGIPKELQLDSEAYYDIMLYEGVYDHRKAELHLVKDYVSSLEVYFKNETEIKLNMQFDDMVSPREYNFETDRVFVKLPFSSVKKLFAASKKDGHKILKKHIEDTCTSYSGFHSYYSNDLDAWLAKPLKNWDHNELGNLFIAVMLIFKITESSRRGRVDVWETLYDEDYVTSEDFYNAFSEGVDWQKLEQKVEEKRDALRAELDPSLPQPVARCKETKDMFKNS